MNAKWSNLALILALAAAPTLLQAQRGGAGGGRALEACRAKNRNSLTRVETSYASIRMPKADQDRYQALLTPIRNVGATLADCDANTPRIAELAKTVDAMVARARANPIYRVGDRLLGGVVVNADTAGKHGLVAAPEDLPEMGGMIFAAAAGMPEPDRLGVQRLVPPVDRGTRPRLEAARHHWKSTGGGLRVLLEQLANVSAGSQGPLGSLERPVQRLDRHGEQRAITRIVQRALRTEILTLSERATPSHHSP